SVLRAVAGPLYSRNIHINPYRYLDSFFFQAEDGIRDLYVTGVQTCALPIFTSPAGSPPSLRPTASTSTAACAAPRCASWSAAARSEERRVGKECRSRWAPDQEKKSKRSSRTGI